jgi:MFS family permease
MVVLGVLLNLSNVAGLLGFVPYAIVGSVLVIRRPGNPIGWLLLLMAAAFSMVGRGAEITGALIGTDWAPWLPMLAWLGTMSSVVLFAGWALLASVFPRGTLPGGGLGRVTRVALAVIVGLGLLQAVGPVFRGRRPDGTTIEFLNPIGIAPDWPGWSFVYTGQAYVVMLGAILVCTVGLLIRFRRAEGTEREQYKWLLASLALIVVAVTFGFLGALVDPDGSWIWIPAIFAFPLPAIAVGIAILRYRLYDIDRLISRTIAYAAVSAILAGVFGVGVLILSTVLTSFAQGESLAVAGSTLAACVTLQPVLRRVRRSVDRRFDRARYDAEGTLIAFRDRVRSQVDVEAVTTDLATTARIAVAPASMSLWLRTRSAGR